MKSSLLSRSRFVLSLLDAPESVSPEECAFFLKEGSNLIPWLEKQVVLLRTINALRKKNITLDQVWNDAFISEAKRVRLALHGIGALGQLCTDAKIPHAFTKALQHWPDMGHDIDLFVMDASLQIDALVLSHLKGVPASSSLVNRISKKTGFDLPSVVTPLEIHHGLIGHVGEHTLFGSLMISRLRPQFLDGVTVPTPSPEDLVLIQVIQRFYGHFYFRLSDVLNGWHLLASPNLNWDIIHKTAATLGITRGVTLYTEILKSLRHDVQKNDHSLEGLFHLNDTGNALKIPMSLPIKLFLIKAGHDFAQGQWSGLGRMALIPFLAAVILGRKVLRKMGVLNS